MNRGTGEKKFKISVKRPSTISSSGDKALKPNDQAKDEKVVIRMNSDHDEDENVLVRDSGRPNAENGESSGDDSYDEETNRVNANANTQKRSVGTNVNQAAARKRLPTTQAQGTPIEHDRYGYNYASKSFIEILGHEMVASARKTYGKIAKKFESTKALAHQVGWFAAIFQLARSVALSNFRAAQDTYKRHPQRFVYVLVAIPFFVAMILYVMRISRAGTSGKEGMETLSKELVPGTELSKLLSEDILEPLNDPELMVAREVASRDIRHWVHPPQSLELIDEQEFRDWRHGWLKKDNISISEPTSVSLVAACQNRERQLQTSLESWLRVRGLSEIIVLDWNSTDAMTMRSIVINEVFLHDVTDSGEFHHRVLFARVENQPDWVLTRAYNLAFQLAQGSIVIKVDCDILLEPNFLELNKFLDTTFMVASPATFRSENDKPLRGGVFMVKRSVLEKVGGYDERIVLYGSEDENLYQRFVTVGGIAEAYLDINTVKHLLAEDKKALLDLESNSVMNKQLAASSGGTWSKLSPAVSTRFNSMLVKDTPSWETVRSEWITQYGFFRPIKRTQHLIDPSLKKDPSTREREKKLGTAADIKVDDVEWYEDEIVIVPKKDNRMVPLRALAPKMEAQLLRQAHEVVLHDGLGVTWDILSQLDIYGLTDLVSCLESVNSQKFIAVVLNGIVADRLAALCFALSVAIVYERALFVVWDGSINLLEQGPIELKDILDISKTNRRLEQDGSKTRMVELPIWKCAADVESCVKWDSVYQKMDEYWLDNLDNELPVAPRKHLVLRMFSWPSTSSSFLTDAIRHEAQYAYHILTFNNDIRLAVSSEPDVSRRVGLYLGVQENEVQRYIHAMHNKRGTVMRLRNGRKRYILAGSHIKALRALHDQLFGKDVTFLMPIGGDVDPTPCDLAMMDDDGFTINPKAAVTLRRGCMKRYVADVLLLMQASAMFPTSIAEDEQLFDRPGMQAVMDVKSFSALPA
eukprot:CAMPEP_0184706294 /NCGR_PEP_ID=MMETSP0313-20130426/36685_1 /TAXON_ID=2792 /ORGANISM="Porphyridium aerugineum, Strain SAG 1380-2" /LENGTH=980 /DNA_ID=CAMNT_0027167843 /DNA_START=236 /DNA_END=3178 /DNA_ORIENTATION=-